MKGLLSANLRAHARRYLATGLAVAISAAFVVLFLSFASGLMRSFTQSASAQFAGASTVITPPESLSSFEDSDVRNIIDNVSTIPGVRAVEPVRQSFLEFSHEGKRITRMLSTLSSPPFSSPTLSRGSLPTSDDGVLVSPDIAKALSVDVGSSLEVAEAYTEDSQTRSLTITGITKALPMESGIVYITSAGMDRLSPTIGNALRLLVAGDSDSPSKAEQESLTSSIADSLAKAGLSETTDVTTADVAVDKMMKFLSTSLAGMMTVLAIFPLISVVVSIIIVSTTFQVVMTQRTRELALLRALGATRSQVRSLIARETLLVGAVASALGALIGAALGGLGLWALGFLTLGPAFLAAFSPGGLAATWLVGTLVAWIAGRRPAAKMGRLSPIAALSSIDVTMDQRRKGRTSLIVFSIISLLAIAGITFGLVHRGTEESFLVTFVSALVLLVSSMGVCSAFFPSIAHLLGVFMRSMTGKLARENVVRSPGRTAATAVAITIGVTLITTMGVGAASTRETILNQVDNRRPVDFIVQSSQGSIPEDRINQIKAVEGTDGLVAVRGSTLVLAPAGRGPQVAASMDSYTSTTDDLPALAQVEGYPDISSVTHSPVENIPDSIVRVSTYYSHFGDSLDVCAQPSSSTEEPVCATLKAEFSESLSPNNAEVSATTLESLAPNAPYTTAIVKLANVDQATDVESRISSIDSSFIVGGGAPERAMYTKAINVLLTGAIALLSVSVLVALVGVSNTLSLSVAERTRENGLLRALGMSRRSVRRMFTLEAVLISLAGSLIGIILGTIFGAIGTASLPLDGVRTVIEIPWPLIGAILAVSLIAALVASWLPGRRASRTSPIEALADE
ncbi:ABC transporter permease [Schaalia sp. ZJ405]|uniref:FtsX-like permease family protein n=1 Tax=Schaalia sp. ZJ405 TaxID=2709403 RepID=UPI0013EA126B|nr:ABC transporter permease [Schaalia sp. ZJ405]QPK81444.1 ABC transporter permease [Schaalia sp. ZJ405]